MKIIKKAVTVYVCQRCDRGYDIKDDAIKCESRPVQLQYINIGDTVRVIDGDGAGESAKVVSKKVIDMEWSHYFADRYWHTIGIEVKFDNGMSRFLTFDGYKLNNVNTQK